MRKFLCSFVCLGLLWGWVTHNQCVAEASPDGFLKNGITAHRGDSDAFPENTIPAFQSAIELGVDWLELDIFRTKDGVLVVTHDRSTRRVADKNLVIETSTYAELAELDVASGHRARKKLTLEQCPPQKMPRLEDILQIVMQQKKTRVSIQPKTDCVADAIKIVRALEAEKWVGFNDGNLKYMQTVKQLAPKIPVFWDRGPNPDLSVDLEIARKSGFESLVLRGDGVTKAKIQQIQAAGFEVGAWTVNDEAVMKRLIEEGIDRLYTDRPALALRLMAERRK